jgi:hypothetical protein
MEIILAMILQKVHIVSNFISANKILILEAKK